MILDTHNRSLQILLGEARATAASDVTACYAQANSAGSFVTTLNHTSTNGTTPVTIVPAPGVGLQYLVNEVRVHNNDSVTHTVILRLLDGATTRIVYSGSVAAGADWVYTPEVGTVVGGGGGGSGSAGVSSWNTRTGAVTMTLTDVTGAGGAPLNAPAFTGVATASTATAGTNTTQLATTAFVQAAVTASTTGVASWNTRTGAVTMTSADVTTALAYTPYDAANPSGYQTAANITTILASPPPIGGTAANTGRFTTIISSVATGTAPFTVASTTNVPNLNASSLNGATFAAPGAIGATTPSTGAFTTLSASGTVSGAGFTALLAPYAPLASPTFTGSVVIPGGTINATTIGATTASTGAFTTLAASGLITPTSNIGIKGTSTIDNAAAGSIGEYVVSNVSVAVSTGVATNITTISLSAGDWDINGVVGYNNATASATQLGAGVSTTSATLPPIGQLGLAQLATPSASINNATQIAIAPTRFIVNATTTVYLVGIATFASGTTNLYGTIRARRMR